MKQFFKFTLASILGVLIASLLCFVIFFSIISGLASSKEKAPKLKPNSIYQLNLKGELLERSQEEPFSIALSQAFGASDYQTLGLDDILKNIQKAKNNPDIVGIYLNCGPMVAGFASLKEIRDALVDFKKSGKFIIAYADNYSQKIYYLASVADQVLLNPQGMLDWKGLAAQVVFFKNTLDKLGVEMQVVKVGTFKSAVEPYVNTKMSDANRQQVTAYTQSIWNTVLSEVSLSRKIPVDKLNAYADELITFQPVEKTLEYQLIDSLLYVEQVENLLKSLIKDTTLKELNYVKHAAMCKVPDNVKFERNKVAILYGVGEIDMGSSVGIQSEEFVKTINKIAKDNSIKAVVFRVNSPGGSAYASEQIWHALTLLKEKKPLIVSMGDYAASGGYYISCMADSIVAQPNTLTGSIGIFGLIPNVKGLNDKIGLTFDGVKTNKLSDAISVNRPFTPEEKDLMQNYVNRGYELFVKRCADGRRMKIDQIKAIAEGRVWSGKEALKIGLVDKIGGIDEAVVMAAKKANLISYQIVEYPKKESFAEKIMKSFSSDPEIHFIKSKLGEQYQLFEEIANLNKINGIHALLPFKLVIQ